MLNIVVPLAGRGSRFVQAGYREPKPLIPIHGKPMIELVVNNVRPRRPHRFIFLALEDHLSQWELAATLHRIAPNSIIIPVAGVTEGAACTVLLARDYIDSDAPLMTVNSDQWVDADINAYLAVADEPGVDGLIMTMWSNHPKWSYVGFDAAGRVTCTAEKEVISNQATVGIYNFRSGRDFVWAAEKMIRKNIRVNNEFYVCPVYNQLLQRGGCIKVYDVGREGDGMYGMGIPQDLEAFRAHPVSRKAAGLA